MKKVKLEENLKTIDNMILVKRPKAAYKRTESKYAEYGEIVSPLSDRFIYMMKHVHEHTMIFVFASGDVYYIERLSPEQKKETEKNFPIHLGTVESMKGLLQDVFLVSEELKKKHAKIRAGKP